MRETTANRFRQQLKPEVDRCIADHEVLQVVRRNGENFIEEDWKAIVETVYLNQFPGLAESFQKAAREPLEADTPLEKLEWRSGRWCCPVRMWSLHNSLANALPRPWRTKKLKNEGRT